MRCFSFLFYLRLCVCLSFLKLTDLSTPCRPVRPSYTACCWEPVTRPFARSPDIHPSFLSLGGVARSFARGGAQCRMCADYAIMIPLPVSRGLFSCCRVCQRDAFDCLRPPRCLQALVQNSIMTDSARPQICRILLASFLLCSMLKSDCLLACPIARAQKHCDHCCVASPYTFALPLSFLGRLF